MNESEPVLEIPRSASVSYLENPESRTSNSIHVVSENEIGIVVDTKTVQKKAFETIARLNGGTSSIEVKNAEIAELEEVVGAENLLKSDSKGEYTPVIIPRDKLDLLISTEKVFQTANLQKRRIQYSINNSREYGVGSENLYQTEISELSREYSEYLAEELIGDSEKVQRNLELVRQSDIRHEYKHLGQTLEILHDSEGHAVNVPTMSSEIRSLELADVSKSLDQEKVSEFKQTYGQLVTYMEIDAMMESYILEKGTDQNQANVVAMARELATLIPNHLQSNSNSGIDTLVSSLDKPTFGVGVYPRAHLAILSGDIDIVEGRKPDLKDVSGKVVEGLSMALHNPEKFVKSRNDLLSDQLGDRIKAKFNRAFQLSKEVKEDAEKLGIKPAEML